VGTVNGPDIDGMDLSVMDIYGNARGSLEYIRISLESNINEPNPDNYVLNGERNPDDEVNLYFTYGENPYDLYLNGFENTTSALTISTVGYEKGDWITGTFSAVLKSEYENEFKAITDGRFKLQVE